MHASGDVHVWDARSSPHFKARRQATEDDVVQQTISARAIDDAFNRLNKFDLLWMSLTFEGVGWKARLRGMWTALTKPPRSFEADILEPVLRKLEEGEHPEKKSVR